MEFRLPENLHHQLLAYDPALKALAKEKKAAEKPEAPRKKTKYPIGNINDLIPANIVDAARMQSAVDYINAQTAPDKFCVFRKPANSDGSIGAVKAIIYYWESVWVAAWFPNADEDYLYGFSYAVSTTKAERKGLRQIRFNRERMTLDLTDMETRKYGRVDYHVHTTTVTLDTVCDSSRYHWDPFCVYGYSAKGKHIKQDCIALFTAEMRTHIPVWKDETIFARVDKKVNNLHHLFGLSLSMFSYKSPEEVDVNWVPTAANIGDTMCKYLDIPITIFAKPFVQKELQLVCTACIEESNNPEAINRRSALKPIKRFIAYMEGIKWINSLWPNAPIDYYQTYKETLSSIEFTSWGMSHLINHYTKAKKWLQEHMPIASMFLILDKAVQEEMLRRNDKNNPVSGLTIYALRDTFTMINNVLDADKPLDPPARWRLTEFHDHVQSEAWKIKNKKEELPQDLFPTPIKITHQEHTWTFLQPMDTHQLSQWGQAVRNCVGTGGYAEDVKKRLQFIVLCMLDGKPKFTIQLKLNHGLMSVHQIAGIGNARLNDDEKSLYTETFKQALAVRSAVV
jgi:hypothetical protein